MPHQFVDRILAGRPIPEHCGDARDRLTEAAASMVQQADAVTAALQATVKNPERVSAVRATQLLDTPPEEVFDRFTRIASHILGAPQAYITLVDAARVFVLSRSVPQGCFYETVPDVPVTNSICPFVVHAGCARIIDDTHVEPIIMDNHAVTVGGVRSYIGVPLMVPGRHTIGTLCGVDTVPRAWSAQNLSMLTELAAVVTMLVEMRTLLVEQNS